MLFYHLCHTFSYNFTAGSAVPVLAAHDEDLVVDCDGCMVPPLLAEKGLRGSKIISLDLNVA